MPSYLEKQWNTYHAVVYIPKDVQPRFGKKKFCKSLETDSKSEADLLKLPYVAEWKALISAARQTKGPLNIESIKEEVRLLREEIRTKWVGYENDAIMELATNLREHPNPKHADELLSRVTGAWNSTHEYVEEWLDAQEYLPKTVGEARPVLKQFCDRFRFFETTTQKDLESWVEELCADLNVVTVKKKIGFVRGFWTYCVEKGHTKAPPPPAGLVKRPKKSKRATAAAMKAMRQPWTTQDYHRLLGACEANLMLTDLIKLAAHTGMRREEICAMKLSNVKPDRFVVEDAKTAAGWRDIPIHQDIKQLVARLVDTSTDGYLLSGLTMNKYGTRGAALGQQFSRLKTRLGYPKHTHVLHCFRKTLAFMMRDAGIPEHHAALIIGHDIDSQTYGLYGDDINFTTKVKIMETVSYRL